MLSENELPNTKSGKITQIIHLSDIHIRMGDIEKSRYDEYRGVFANLFEKISSLQSIINNKSVIVVTGDFFETKNKIESCGMNYSTYS